MYKICTLTVNLGQYRRIALFKSKFSSIVSKTTLDIKTDDKLFTHDILKATIELV